MYQEFHVIIINKLILFFMENTNVVFENKSTSLIENEFEYLKITPEMEKNLLTTSNWSVFIAIVGIAFSVLMVMVGVMMLSLNQFTSEFQDFQSLPAGFMSYFSLLYFFLGILYFFPSFFLIKFALKTKKSIKEKNQNEMEEGVKNMKRLATVTGIMTILMIIMSIAVPIMVAFFTAAKQMGAV